MPGAWGHRVLVGTHRTNILVMARGMMTIMATAPIHAGVMQTVECGRNLRAKCPRAEGEAQMVAPVVVDLAIRGGGHPAVGQMVAEGREALGHADVAVKLEKGHGKRAFFCAKGTDRARGTRKDLEKPSGMKGFF